jgi:type II secretory pathway pseudopilin PulG
MRMQREKGLSLIEVVIILAVMVVLVALLVPSTVQILTGARRNVTLDEMENLKKAMIGDPDLKTSGVRSNFAYLGDMGNLPSTLDDLVTQGAQPAYAFNSSKGVGAGWRGPYITLGPGSDAASHRVDAFGNLYTYSITNFTNAQGQTVDAQVVSLGADGVAGGTGNDEDVTLETLVAETTATVTGYGFDLSGNPLNGATVTMNYPASGSLTSPTTTTDSSGFYQFTNIPFGIRSVSFNPRLLLVPGSVRTGTSTNNVEFRVANFSTSAIIVSDFTATFTPVGGAAFLRSNILWNAATVWSCAGNNPMGSAETVNVNPDQTTAADANPTPPQRVAVDASNVQVPDIKILGSGTEARIELIGFRTTDGSCTAGTARAMNGATFSDVTMKDALGNIVAQLSFTVP